MYTGNVHSHVYEAHTNVGTVSDLRAHLPISLSLHQSSPKKSNGRVSMTDPLNKVSFIYMYVCSGSIIYCAERWPHVLYLKRATYFLVIFFFKKCLHFRWNTRHILFVFLRPSNRRATRILLNETVSNNITSILIGTTALPCAIAFGGYRVRYTLSCRLEHDAIHFDSPTSVPAVEYCSANCPTHI